MLKGVSGRPIRMPCFLVSETTNTPDLLLRTIFVRTILRPCGFSQRQRASDRCCNIAISLVIRYEKLNGQETAVPSPARRDLFSGTSHLLFTGRTHLIFGAPFLTGLKPRSRDALSHTTFVRPFSKYW